MGGANGTRTRNFPPWLPQATPLPLLFFRQPLIYLS